MSAKHKHVHCRSRFNKTSAIHIDLGNVMKSVGVGKHEQGLPTSRCLDSTRQDKSAH